MAKPIDELTIADFEAHPVWKFSMDEEEGDETYVRPVVTEAVPADSDYEVYQVACDLTAATGTRFTGFLQVSNGEFHFLDPIIVGGTEDYWCLDSPPARRERAKFEAFFGAEYSKLFPMSWCLRVPFAGEASKRNGVYQPDAESKC
jgi:hypothetical protein